MLHWNSNDFLLERAEPFFESFSSWWEYNMTLVWMGKFVFQLKTESNALRLARSQTKENEKQAYSSMGLAWSESSGVSHLKLLCRNPIIKRWNNKTVTLCSPKLNGSRDLNGEVQFEHSFSFSQNKYWLDADKNTQHCYILNYKNIYHFNIWWFKQSKNLPCDLTRSRKYNWNS